MNEQQNNPQDAGPRARCVCQEVLQQLRECLGISPAVRQHLANSRVEFLKAIRTALDERIERVAAAGRQGTNVPVE
jgi:hypothetical protein